MKNLTLEDMDISMFLKNNSLTFCIGKIIEINFKGQAFVDFEGNPYLKPILARTLLDKINKSNCNDENVLLFFQNGDPGLPIIVGLIHNAFSPETTEKEISFPEDKSLNVKMDQHNVIIEANEQIILRCGKSSVTLKKDGKIIVKGTNIISRASGNQKIKGASVQIN